MVRGSKSDAGTLRVEGGAFDLTMPLKLRARLEGGDVVEARLEEGRVLVVGSGAACDLVLADRAVSRRHASFALGEGGVTVRDLGSSNGTMLLDQRIKEAVVSPGTTVVIGRTHVTVDVDQDELAGGAPPYDADSYEGLVGGSAPMRRLYGLLQRLERSSVSALIEGESGVGKELVARALHARSGAKGQLVAINCGALDRALVASELFGHRRGAFTGATDARDGAFVAADQGTLLLDEIGELPLEVQPVLLRVLETREVRAVGADRPRPVPVRVLAATHRDLEAEVAAKRFREDLFYRLAVVRLVVPPLRARVEDGPALIERFASELSAQVPPTVVRTLAARRWPGNVRELRNAVQAWVALGVLPALPRAKSGEIDEPLREFAERDAPYAELKEELVDRFTRAYFTALLARCGGNRSEAARRAGIDRSYINRLLAKTKD